jgi:hypothetical protein
MRPEINRVHTASQNVTYLLAGEIVHERGEFTIGLERVLAERHTKLRDCPSGQGSGPVPPQHRDDLGRPICLLPAAH